MSDDIDRPSISDCFVSSGVRDVSGVSVGECLESFTLCRCELSPYIYHIVFSYDFVVVLELVRGYCRRFLGMDIAVVFSTGDLFDSQYYLSISFCDIFLDIFLRV